MSLSTRTNRKHYDVAVVGFGPSGAVAACLLGQFGLATLCIDKSTTVYDKPRAIAIDHEILRVLQGIGVIDRVAPHLADFPASEYYGVDGQLIKRIDTVPKPFPLGYTPTMVFTQPPVEAILRERARSLDNVDVSLGTELQRFSDDAQGVTLQLQEADGREWAASARYMIACDGASSRVRSQLDIGYDDLGFDEPWVVIDVMVNPDSIDKLPQHAIQYCEPDRPCTYIVGPGNHRRWEIMLRAGEDPTVMQSDAVVWKLLARWMTPEDGVLWRAASYRFHALVAQTWRKGAVFIAGDAAHQQPPFIGQGMCQGIRDVVNVSWKLNEVIRGRAADRLLDTYETERSAHVRRLTTRIKDIGRLICEQDGTAARARDQRLLAEAGGVIRTVTRQDIVPPLHEGLISRHQHEANGSLFPQPRLLASHGHAACLLDTLAGSGWRIAYRAPVVPPADLITLSRECDARWLRLTDIEEGPDTSTDDASSVLQIVEAEEVVARWFTRHHCNAAIVRPDHYVYGVAQSADQLQSMLAELVEMLASAGRPVHAGLALL